MRRKIGSVIKSEADRRPPTQAAPRVAASTMSTVMRSTTLAQVQAQTAQDAQRSKGSSTSIEANGPVRRIRTNFTNALKRMPVRAVAA